MILYTRPLICHLLPQNTSQNRGRNRQTNQEKNNFVDKAEASRIGSRQAHRHLHAAGLNHHSRPDKHTFPASLQFETEGALFEKRILKLRAAFIDVGDEWIFQTGEAERKKKTSQIQ